MDIVFANIIPITGVVAFVLGYLSLVYDKTFKVFLVAALPMVWLGVKFLAPFLQMTMPANRDSVLGVLVGFYEMADPSVQIAVNIAPVLFVAGRIISHIYKIYFYKEKVETMRERKKRIQSEYDFAAFD